MKNKDYRIKSDFCKKLEGDFGFQYLEAFCHALEVYLSSLEAFNPKAFEYRGAYLRYAVERYLYFYFVKNVRLYSCFREWVSSRTTFVNKTLAGVERNLALCLCGIKLTPENATIRFRHRMNFNSLSFYLRFLIWKWAYSPFAHFFRIAGPKRHNGVDILIYVPAKKFVRYLSKITEILPFSFSYLVDNSNSNIASFLINQKLPFIDSTKLKFKTVRNNLNTLPKELTEFRTLFFWYDCLHGALSLLRPRCVVIAEGNGPGDELMNQACKQLSIPVICLQHGWSFIVHNGFRNMTYTKMLTWGEAFSELLQPYNFKQNFVAVGSHIIEQDSAGVDKSASFAPKAISFFLQVPSRLINEECWNEFFKLIVWTAVEFEHVAVLVREFPISPLPKQLRKELNKYPNIKMRSSRKYPLLEVLKESQLVISICSSTIFESIAAGVLPIIFNMTSMPKFFPDIEAAGAGIEVKNPQAARDAIRRCLTDNNYRKQFEPGMKLFQEQYFYKNDGKAAERIMQEIVSIIKA